MNEAIMLSIKPEYCKLIMSGDSVTGNKKTLELRKSKPKLKLPFKVYIYETKSIDKTRLEVCVDSCERSRYYRGKGKVIGEFICDKIYQYTTMDNKAGVDISDEDIQRMSMLTIKQIEEYEEGITNDFCLSYYGVYGWHISNLIIYDKPKDLDVFSRLRRTKFGMMPVNINRSPSDWIYVSADYVVKFT